MLNWIEINEWCDELRHTTRSQVKGVLDDGRNGRCCLGVKIELMAHLPPRQVLDCDDEYDDLRHGEWPDAVQTSTLEPEYASDMTQTQMDLLAAFNDGGVCSINRQGVKLTFAEIADVVQMFFSE